MLLETLLRPKRGGDYRAFSLIFHAAGQERRRVPRRNKDLRLHVRSVPKPGGGKRQIATYCRFYDVDNVQETNVWRAAGPGMPEELRGRTFTRDEARAVAREHGRRAVFNPAPR